MKPDSICLIKQNLVLRRRERDFEKKMTGEVPHINQFLKLL